MKKQGKWLLIAALLAPSVQAYNAPLSEVDTLHVSARTIYPPELNTVGQAAEWLLEPLGYHIITDFPAPTSAKSILQQPIPTAAKMHRTMPVTHVLQLLIGEGNTIVVDRKNRLITFSKGVLL